ncbi:AAA family ATPase [Rhodanobacter aciditrophus]|uniref:AAA family ATPase n=1 Tax=Rhodanobacter aciditrophus TaxID=1623218 RepID=A0ABW4B4R2_9GAMM
MAKKQNRPTPPPQGSTAAALKPTPAMNLEKQVPMWTASFESASKIYQSTNNSLNINVDQQYLKALINAIPADKANEFGKWIQRFADVCKEIGRYQQNLEQEYSARWDTCNQKWQEAESKEREQAKLSQELADAQAEFSEQQEELQQQQTLQAKLQGELTKREREISARELNAEADFEQQNRKALEKLKQQHQDEKATFKTALAELQKQKYELELAIQKAQIELTAAEQERKRALDERDLQLEQSSVQLATEQAKFAKEKALLENARQALKQDKQTYKLDLDLGNEFTQQRIENDRQQIEFTLSVERQKIDAEWEDLRQAKENLDALVDEAMERERESHSIALDKLNAKLDDNWGKIDDLKDQLSSFRDLENALGSQTAEEFLQQLDNLKDQNRQLERQLNESDTAELQETNEFLRSRVSDLETELSQLRPQLLQAQTEAAHKRIAATELYSKEQENRLLTQHKNTLQVHIDDLESRISQLTDAHKTQTPFPAMSGMDTGKDFQATMELEDIPDLSTFAEELQHRIALAERVKLYYPIEDIRTLLGGLAMSQLHVFQGISGTGKTSLAKAFAKAMGGFCTDIAVQAGWRDRDDLLGHYNAFERKFYEKDCLQALYQAQTPRWSDTCNVILLDEMNLSRPEQYFSEFLSALEKNDRKERLISLAETALPNAPKGLKEGRQILVPSNVWFIGTANHDETTNELADKTYDRAHVMTLPKQDNRFKITKYDSASFSFTSLQRAFQQASQQHTPQVQELLKQLADHDITTQLAETFDLGWGNRFERQAKRFIPVMLACGATEGEALDHLLSTRVMRNGKVTGRYDVTAEDVGKLSDALQDFWSKTDLKGDPDKSLQLLETDRQRKERGG